ncbi:hypothetical protein ABY45_00690, partial [Microbacterium maritypicum]|uniref:hypothetical protein n=1 Tax=Microbacterium maritypicum TaxID=33918 RepID=UPI003D6EB029
SPSTRGSPHLVRSAHPFLRRPSGHPTGTPRSPLLGSSSAPTTPVCADGADFSSSGAPGEAPVGEG